jgi:hypothetical protein
VNLPASVVFCLSICNGSFGSCLLIKMAGCKNDFDTRLLTRLAASDPNDDARWAHEKNYYVHHSVPEQEETR